MASYMLTELPYQITYGTLHALQAAVGNDNCPSHAALWGVLGSSLGLVFANIGAAYGIAVSFGGYTALGRKDRSLLIKGLVPAIMASVRGVYGLIIAILIAVQISKSNYSLMKGFGHMFSGFSVGLSGLASGMCMGVIGNAGMAAVAKQPRIYIGVLLILIFAEAIGLYGLIIALILLSAGAPPCA